MTDRYAVIGNPVAHSKSPEIHALFAAQTAQDIAYTRRLAPLDGFRDEVTKFFAEGGCGANVTVPFKLEAHDLAHEVSQRAKDARAANLLKHVDGRIFADNTDGAGLLRDLTSNIGAALADKRVLLIGAGGAAQGVLVPLLEAQPAILAVVNRTVEKAMRLAENLRRNPLATHTVVSGRSFHDLQDQHFDVVINATSSSLSGEVPPLPAGIFDAGALAYDMMYGAKITPFLDFARVQGVTRLADGLGMLVEQAAESFQIWRGIRPDTAPVIAALRKA